MKKNISLVTAALALVFFMASCSKSDTTPATNNAAVQGKWTGVFTPPLGPSPYFAVTFNTDGSVLVEQNSMTTPDTAHGTWSVTGNNISATYTFTGSMTGTYSLAGTYTASSAQIAGTIGTGTNTTGYATFNVSK